MDPYFGISLDSSAVIQRHTLYDSEEEEDEDTECQKPTFMKFVFNIAGRITVGTPLIITIGQPASIFVKSHFILKPQPQSVLISNTCAAGGDESGLVGSATDQGKVYPAEARNGENAETQFYVHHKNLKPEFVNVWCAEMFKTLKPSSVLVLTSLPAYTHLSPHSPDLSTLPCFLRMITTSSWTHPPFAPPLESPNVVSGEAAAVLTHCQIHDLPAALVALYTTSSQSMTEQVVGFSPLLEHTSIDELNLATRSSIEALKVVKTLEPRPREDLSSLYT